MSILTSDGGKIVIACSNKEAIKILISNVEEYRKLHCTYPTKNTVGKMWDDIYKQHVLDDNDSNVSCKPTDVLEPLYPRHLYSQYSHEGKCGGDWCIKGCWKSFCERCRRGNNRAFASCCFNTSEILN